jgi:ferric-dicitrate binding protein FerR (iron transport regulator)
MSANPLLTKPRLKKSETLEIRLPYPTKLAFMARCRDEGRSASEALRLFIDGHLDGASASRPARPAIRLPGRLPGRLLAGALIAAAVGAIAVPSLARPNLQAEFDRLATGADHSISLADLARLDANHDGKISFKEFRAGYEGRTGR